MGSGSTLRKRVSFSLLFALTLLTGCLQFEPGNTVSWSPSGRRLAFISGNKAWVYDLKDGSMRALPAQRDPSGVAWSPREDVVATSTAGLVETFVEGADGVFSSSRAFVMPFLGSDALSLLVWHPSGDRLLDVAIGNRQAETTEIDLPTREATKLGPGVGLYGPAAQWLMWAAQAPIGRRDDKIVFDRQSPSGDSLPLAAEASRALETGYLDAMTTAQDQRSSQPLCVRREDSKRVRTEFYCLDDEGEVRLRASLPVVGYVFSDQDRRLFAVIEEKSEQAPTLRVYDADGKLRADGRSLLAAISARFDKDDQQELRASRLAWSPDGNWLAWVVAGRLWLWNWRNDAVRMHAPPA